MELQRRLYMWKLVKTAVMFCGLVISGMYLSMLGPMTPDLRYMVNANYEELGRVGTIITVPSTIIALITAVVVESFRPYIGLIICACQQLPALGLFLAPWCRSLATYTFANFLFGGLNGIMTTGGNAWLMWIWGEQASAPIHSFHFGWGVGAFIAPQFVKSWLSDSISTVVNATNITAPNITAAPETTQTTVIREANLVYPFSIAGIIVSAYGFVYLFLFFQERMQLKADEKRNQTRDAIAKAHENEKGFVADQIEYNGNNHSKVENGELELKPSKEEEADEDGLSLKQKVLNTVNPSSCTGGQPKFGIVMAILVFLYHFVIVAGERVWGAYLFTYVKESHFKFSTEEASNLQSAYSLTFLISRGVATLLSTICPPNIMVTAELILYLGSAIVLAVFPYNRTVIWVGSCAFAFFLGPLFPGGVCIYNQYIEVTAVIIVLSQIGASAGSFFTWAGGYLIQYQGPMSLLYFNFIYIGVGILLYCAIQIVGIKNKRQNKDSPTSYELGQIEPTKQALE